MSKAIWMLGELAKAGDGDINNKFDSLTNSTITDANSKVCRTVVASRPLGLLKQV